MKTIKDTLTSGDDNIVNYFDEVGNTTALNIKKSSLTVEELAAYNSWEAVKQARINALDKVLDLVANVGLSEGKFVVTGEVISPKVFAVDDLATIGTVYDTGKTQKQIYDDLAAFINIATGSPLVSMNAPFGTGFVIVNMVIYPYAPISISSGSVMTNATKLARYLLNS